MKSSNRKGAVTKGQLTSGLRTGSAKRSQRGVFADVQIQPGAGVIAPTHPLTPKTNVKTKENFLADIDEDKEISNGPDLSSELRAKTPALNVPKIPGMLNRETTSYGVFSNLAAHNRPPKHEAIPVEDDSSTTPATRGSQTQLLRAIKDNDFRLVTKILNGNANMALNFTDKAGDTPLTLGVTTGNDQIMKLVMSKRSPINAMNQNGQSALHLAASGGLEHVAHMLIQDGADVNLQNEVTGYTALHEAVSSGHKHMLDLLLCCGADQTIRTKDGLSPLDMCREKSARKEFQAAAELINTGGMELGTVGQSVARFKSVGVMVEPRQIVEPTGVVCRRRGVSSRNTTVKSDSPEEIISDEFSLRVGNKDISYPVLITLAIESGKSNSSEEIVVKTGDGEDIQTSDVWQESGSHWCKFGATIHEEATFLAVCRPRTEQLEVGRGASIVTSAANLNVKVHVGKGSFTKTAHISLRVMEIHEEMVMEEGDILSSTPFYKIGSSEPLARPVDVELPEPVQYGDEKSATVVLTKYSSNGSWSVEDKARRVGKEQGSVIFPISDLPVYAVVLKCKTGYKATSVSVEVQQTFEQLSNQTDTVCFLCLSKWLQTENSFKVVLECCKVKLLDSRRRFWISNGFVEQQEKALMDQIIASPNQAFSVTFYENILLRAGGKHFTLEFHPKRYNVVQFDVQVDKADSHSGRIYIHPNKDTEDDVNSEDDLLTSIDVSLDSKKLERQSTLPVISSMTKSNDGDVRSNRDVKSKTDSASKTGSMKAKTKQLEVMVAPDSVHDDKSAIHFLTNEFLGTLVDQIEEDWYKTFALMGMPFSDIEEALMRDVSPGRCQIKLFKEWRDMSKEREDIGIPLLLSALFKGGRRDVANTVQIELRNLYNKGEDKNTTLYKWLCRAYQDSNLFVPSDYPKPMSDAYLVLMADELIPSRELGRALGLVASEIDEILDCSNYLYPGIKVMKMLTLFREAIPSKLEGLERLIGCLERLNYDKLRNYAVMCAKAWVKRTATRKDDPLRTQVDTLMRKL